MQLVLDTKGIELSKRNQSFYVTDGTEKRSINPKRLHAITITTHGKISTSAIRLAAEHQIPIYILGTFGKVEARIQQGTFGNNTALRRNQIEFRKSTQATTWVKELLTEKINQQKVTIEVVQVLYNLDKAFTEGCKARIETYVETINGLQNETLDELAGTLRALEANAARVYWSVLKTALPKEWQFIGRTTHAATDNFNVLLNYTYGMLYTNIETAIFSAGLDPGFGIWHADIYGKPSLSFDLIEPFRAITDRWLLKMIADKALYPTTDKDEILNKTQRQVLIKAYHQLLYGRLWFQGSNTTFRNHLYRYAGTLSKIITNVVK